MIKPSIFLFLAFALRSALADLPKGMQMQLTCDGIKNNSCFENPKGQKCQAIFRMIEAKLSLYVDGYGDEDPSVRRLQEEEEPSGANLRGSDRQLQGCGPHCALSEYALICEFYGCNRRLAVAERELAVCEDFMALDAYLVDFPTKPIEKCLDGVNCKLEYLC